MRLPRKLKKKVKKQRQALMLMQIAILREITKAQVLKIASTPIEFFAPASVAIKAAQVAEVMVDFSKAVNQVMESWKKPILHS